MMAEQLVVSMADMLAFQLVVSRVEKSVVSMVDLSVDLMNERLGGLMVLMLVVETVD